jgi:predicted kinase
MRRRSIEDNMLIHLNGLPGVGKLTIARSLHGLTGGHLLDNHTIYNPAFSLCEFRSPAFYAMVRSIRTTAYTYAATIPADTTIVLTNCIKDTEWGRENWTALLDLSTARRCPFLAVTLQCDVDEHRQRLINEQRLYLRKLTDWDELPNDGRALLEYGASSVLHLDTTRLTPRQSAEAISAWVNLHRDAVELFDGNQNCDNC